MAGERAPSAQCLLACIKSYIRDTALHNLRVVVHTCNLITKEMEVNGSEVEGQLWFP